MKEFLARLRVVAHNLRERHGPLALFGLFLRDGAPNVWDLLVAAPWLSELSLSDGIKVVAEEVEAQLLLEDRLRLSRIVVLEEEFPVLAAIQETTSVNDPDCVEIRDSEFGGIDFERGYLLVNDPAAWATESSTSSS